MCSRYTETQCTVCQQSLNQLNCRIIVEVCGHRKCRECFIKEENGCTVCTEISLQQPSTNPGSIDRSEKSSTSLTNGSKDLSNDAVIAVDTDSNNLNTETEPKCSNSRPNYVNNIRIIDNVLITPQRSSEPECSSNGCSQMDVVKSVENASHIMAKKEAGKIVSYTCTICKKSWQSRNHRKYHLFCDKNQPKPFRCNQCDREFVTFTHLQYHRDTHVAYAGYSCQLCDKIYSREIGLKRHMRKHQNEYKYECGQCKEKFLYKEQFNAHQNRHNNISHKCPECGKRFLIKSNLTKHIQSHSGQNRRKCSICQKLFSGSSALKTHMLTHSKSKPHQCNQCVKKFIDQRTLERHLKTHSDALFYECVLCSAKSGRKDNIRRHVRNLHSDSGKKLQTILNAIFDNFTNKLKQLKNPTPTIDSNKTECMDVDDSHSIQTSYTNEKTEPPDHLYASDTDNDEDTSSTNSPNIIRNIATSVIKFAGRSNYQEQSENHIDVDDAVNNVSQSELNKTPSDNEENSNNHSQRSDDNQSDCQKKSRAEETNAEKRSTAANPIPEIGIELTPYNYAPLTYDPFPEIEPLPLLNTNTNLTVYRQLLSPYLKRTSAISVSTVAGALHQTNSDSVSVPAIKSNAPPPIVRNRPPKKMIEKYELYRS